MLTFFPQISGKTDAENYYGQELPENTVEIASYANQLTGITDVQLLSAMGSQWRSRAFQNLRRLRAGFGKFASGVKRQQQALITMTEEKPGRSICLFKRKNAEISYFGQEQQHLSKGPYSDHLGKGSGI